MLDGDSIWVIFFNIQESNIPLSIFDIEMGVDVKRFLADFWSNNPEVLGNTELELRVNIDI